MNRALETKKRARANSHEARLPLRRCSRLRPGQVTLITNLPINSTRTPNLCARCEKLDFDNIFRRDHIGSQRRLVQELPHNIVTDPDCPLCLMLLKICPPKSDAVRVGSNSSQRHLLESSNCSKRFHWGWKAVDKVILTIDNAENQPFIISQGEGESPVGSIPPSVDFEVIKSWLAFCEKHHTRNCCADPRLELFSESLSSLIPSFRLIDCKERTFVPASGQKYVALSYVWGGFEAPPFTGKVSEELPKTLEDAMAVTREMGFRYIWIDMICINQKDSQEKKEQISRMDLIYKRADLTIIAAAGSNPQFGLCGVGGQSRRALSSIKFGKRFITAVSPNPINAIMSSPWYKRGWTYQEGLLSRRRLVFTEEQVYFECGAMYCSEILNVPLVDLHTDDCQQFQISHCNGINIGLFPRHLGSDAWEITSRIHEFLERKLSEPKDILNALLGILKVFETGPQRLLHCWGVPLFSRLPKPLVFHRPHRSSKSAKTYDLCGWSATDGFYLGLAWNTVAPGERRVGFPSWSWTGWTSEIEWGISQWRSLDSLSEEGLQIQVQFKEGQIMDIEDYAQHPGWSMDQLSNILHISAWATEVTFPTPADIENDKTLQYKAYVDVKVKGRRRMVYRPTGSMPTLEKKCIGILLGHERVSTKARGDNSICILLVQEIDLGSSVYERIGLGWMKMDKQDYLDDFKNGNWYDGVDEVGYYRVKTSLNLKIPLPELVKSRYHIQLQ